MSILKRIVLVGIVSILPLNTWGATPREDNNKEIPVAVSPVKISYKPPLRGIPTGRIGGGTRGAAERESFSLLALAPDHVGYTVREQPCFYWYISKPTDYSVKIAVIERNGVKPLLEKVVKGPEKNGIQSVCLADHGVVLSQNVLYKWFVTLVTDADQLSKDIFAGGMISMVEPSAVLTAKLKDGATGLEAASAYAEDGLWYDTLDSISKMIEASPDNVDLRKQRAALLEQVGLAETTRYEKLR